MKTVLILVSAATVVVGTIAADKSSTPRRKATPVQANATNLITVEGMHCDGCAKGLCAELKLTPGVAGAVVTLSNRLAQVTYDSNKVSTVRLLKVVEQSGFHGRVQP